MNEMEFLNNSPTAWLTALVVAAAVYVGLGLARAVVIRQLRRLADRTSISLDDLAADVLSKTKPFFLFAIAVYAGSRFLAMSEIAATWLEKAVVIAVFAQAALWANVALDAVLRRKVSQTLEEDAATGTTLRFLGFIVRLGVLAGILLVALDNLGIEINTLIAGLGVGGIAVALAVQNVLGDLFGSLSIVLDKPFVIGDFIIVGDLMGTVEHIGLKTTRVRSLSGEQLVFSNNDLLGSRIRNFKRMFERRVVFRIGVVYGTPKEQLAAIPGMIREIIEAQDHTRVDRVHFAAYGASSLDFEIVYYVLEPDYNVYMDVQQAINLDIYGRFEEEGIEFAFPTQSLHIESVPSAVPPAVPAGGGEEVAGGD